MSMTILEGIFVTAPITEDNTIAEGTNTKGNFKKYEHKTYFKDQNNMLLDTSALRLLHIIFLLA